MNAPCVARRLPWYAALFAAMLVLAPGAPAQMPALPAAPAPPSAELGFSFAVVTDMRYYAGPGVYDSPSYFRGAMQAMGSLGPVAFVLTPGDMDPVPGVMWTITSTLGNDAEWVPVTGNHELPDQGVEPSPGANLAWLRAYPHGADHPGPAGCLTTTFSFDRGPAHFAVLNEYCDAAGDAVTDGDVPDHLYAWLAADLAAHPPTADRPYTFVVGHEPAYPQPDADNGRLRHEDDSLNAHEASRNRFWALLRQYGVAAYLCGHTHNTSAVEIGGVWQVDGGHARGLGDTGVRSTFLVIRAGGSGVYLETYRDDAAGGAYSLWDGRYLRMAYRSLLPVTLRAPGAAQ